MDVSIIITAYNYAAYLQECLQSCLFQNESALEYEIIVIDDGSIDQTPTILEKYENPKLRKYRIKNCGIERASNIGIEKARGDYIVRVDADDMLLPSYLQNIQPYLKDVYGFYYPDYEVINAGGEIMEEMVMPEFNTSEIRMRGDFLATGTLYSANALTKIGGYSTAIKNSGLENYELILRLIQSGVNGKHIPESLFRYRRHSLNISETKKEQIVRNGRSMFLKMGLGTFTTNEYHPYKLKLEVE